VHKYLGPILLLLFCTSSQAQDASLGKKLLTEKAFIKAFWPTAAYENLWKVWGLREKPKNYESAVRERFGLHPAPFANNGYPMGLRKADLVVGKGVGIDCLTCHGGSIFGESLIGLGNHSLDIHTLFEEFATAAKNPLKLPFQFSQVRGTSEAGGFAVYLLGMRDNSLGISEPRNLGLHDDSCEDVPAWWLLKKKQTMYHVGATDSRSVRSLMQFMMHPLTVPQEFQAAEAEFKHIQAYIKSIDSPKYPFPINREKAAEGEKLFLQHCSSCHGTYGSNPTYPNKIIPLEKIGTDPKRFHNIGPKFAEAYNASWFAQEGTGMPLKATKGYQAPPLDGIWATAPYFHNGSVPTLEGVLNSEARPKLFTRSFGTSRVDFDEVKIGWKVQELKAIPTGLTDFDKRKYYDTRLPGRGNTGHPFGDGFTDSERSAVIEYLKRL
jgi:hypothetical protein